MHLTFKMIITFQHFACKKGIFDRFCVKLIDVQRLNWQAYMCDVCIQIFAQYIWVISPDPPAAAAFTRFRLRACTPPPVRRRSFRKKGISSCAWPATAHQDSISASGQWACFLPVRLSVHYVRGIILCKTWKMHLALLRSGTAARNHTIMTSKKFCDLLRSNFFDPALLPLAIRCGFFLGSV